MDKIIIVDPEGKTITLVEWQTKYALEVGSDQIGRHFSLKDPKLAEDLRQYGELIVNEKLIRFLDDLREYLNMPLTINSFNRNEAKQLALKAAGYKTATTSPHVAKMAADIGTADAAQTRDWAQKARTLAESKGLKIRLGFEQYLAAGQHFLHIDVCPEYFAPGKPFHNQSHPPVWENAIHW